MKTGLPLSANDERKQYTMTRTLFAYAYQKDLPLPKTKWRPIAFFSLLSVLMGMFLLGYVGWSTVGSYALLLTAFPSSRYMRPVTGDVLGVSTTGSTLVNVRVVRTSDGFPAFVTDAHTAVLAPPTFTLDVPSLGLKDAVVGTNSQEFEKNLGHFPGTGLPGERGNVFISGHSVLPQFFNPKDYKTIFSTLPSIKLGEEISLTMNGLRYTYTVVKKIVVDPNDISVLLPPDPTGRFVSLMTCVPPGLNLKRLVVIGRLTEEIPESDDGIPGA
ncbi:MAG: sortase [bacterium]|nr:sortase [bacterium]